MTARWTAPLLALLIGLAFITSAKADDAKTLDGTWKTTVPGQNGAPDRVTTFVFKLDGTKLTGTVSGRNNTTTPIDDGGTFTDGTLNFTITRDNNGTKIVTTYTGKMDGDTITGSRTAPPRGGGDPVKRDWKATRSTN